MDILIGLYWISFVAYLVLTLLSNNKEDKWFWLVFCWAAPVLIFFVINNMRTQQQKRNLAQQQIDDFKKRHDIK